MTEPTEQQVEAAANALYDQFPEVFDIASYKALARAALVAALLVGEEVPQ